MADSHQMFIGGEWVNSSTGETRDIISPHTGAVIATVQEGSAEDANRAVAAAKKAFDETWFDSTPKDRQLALLKLADAIEANAEEIVKIESENAGKPADVTMSEEIPPIVDNLRFFAGAARTLEGRSAGEYMAGYTSMVRREPIGVAGLIAPWNYPLMMAVWKIGPALATGNTVVLKPSELTPLTALRVAELAADIFPPGVFNVDHRRRRPGRRHPRAARRRRHRLADRRHRDRQAHREELVRHAETRPPRTRREGARHRVRRRRLSRRPSNGSRSPGTSTRGRTARRPAGCSSRTRCTTTSSATSSRRSRTSRSAARSRRTSPSGRSISKEQVERVEGFLERASAGGAEIVTGGESLGTDGYHFKPTVVANPSAGLRDRPEGGLRPGRDRAAVLRRGPGASRGRTGSSTGCPARCGPATWAARCAWPGACSTAASG